MAELALLVNSTDTALLAGRGVSPVTPDNMVTDSATTGGFASVLGKQLAPGEGAVAKESLPPIAETQSNSLSTNGDPRPLNGKALPPAERQNTVQTEADDPALDGSLIFASAQSFLGDIGLPGNTLATGATSLLGDPAFVKPGMILQSAQSALEMARTTGKNGMPGQLTNPNLFSVVNQTANLPMTNVAESVAATALPNAAQDVQRSVSVPAIPALLGKPISAMAEQALARISLATGTSKYVGADIIPATGATSTTTQTNNSLPSMLIGMNSLTGNAQRMDTFNAAMGAITQGRAETQLPVNSASQLSPVSLLASAAPTDGTINMIVDAPRLPSVTGAVFSPALAIASPVGQSAWAGELAQRVTWLANSELREAQLQLHPRSLGTVEVRIAYGPEQQLNVSFNVSNPIARDALEASLPRLREMFEQQGLNLADANVSNESSAERERSNNLNDESSTQDGLLANTDVFEDGDETYQTPSRWLKEGMLDAYA